MFFDQYHLILSLIRSEIGHSYYGSVIGSHFVTFNDSERQEGKISFKCVFDLDLIQITPDEAFLVTVNRIKKAVDNALRQEQAGFRPGRSCNDQMFTLRQILETVTAGRNPTIFNFIDFCKAFDSVHRPALWKILRMYVRLSRANNIYSAPNAQSEPIVTLVNGSVC